MNVFQEAFDNAGPLVSGSELLRSIESATGAPIDANTLIWFLLSYFPDAGLIAVKRVIRSWYTDQDFAAVDAAVAALWSTASGSGDD
jgi:hypothetical protein